MRFFLVGITVLFLGSFTQDTTKDNGNNVLEVMNANLQKVRDYQFVFEGEIRLVFIEGGIRDTAQVANEKRKRSMAAAEEDYQGVYAFRVSDRATLLDVYHRKIHANAPLRRRTQALLRSKIEEIEHVPDFDRRLVPVKELNGGPGSFNNSGSPELFLPYWIIPDVLNDPLGRHFQVNGWEEVEERKCLHIQFDEFNGDPRSDRPTIHMWIDLTRGGLPLQIEYWLEGAVRRRTAQIRLDRMSTPEGHDVWMPTSGTTEVLAPPQAKIPGQPLLREVCSIVRSSLRMNSTLKDDFFLVRRERLSIDDPLWKKTRQEFEGARSKRGFDASFRTDADGVRGQLAANLAEADRQAKQLEASSPERESWSWGTPWQLVFFALASILLVATFLCRKRLS